MGHIERSHIHQAIRFVAQLDELQIPTGCLQTSLIAMGANIDLYDVMQIAEFKAKQSPIAKYVTELGFEVSASFHISEPISVSQLRPYLEDTKAQLASINYAAHSWKRVAGVMLSFGAYDTEPPHVIGILPRNRMSKVLRKILTEDDAHVIIDSSHLREPVYPMTTVNIAHNINAYIVNNIRTEFHIVTKNPA